MTAIVDAFLADLDDQALDRLAELLAPRLASRAAAPTGPLTTRQAAQRAGVHERTIRRALAAGTLAGQTIAGRWRIDVGDVDTWLAVGAPTCSPTAEGCGRRRRQTGPTDGAAAIRGAAHRQEVPAV